MTKGSVAALWAALAWVLLTSDTYAPVVIVSVLVAAATRPRTLRRHTALIGGTLAFAIVIAVVGFLLRVPPVEIGEGVLRLTSVVLVVPLAAEFVDVFWLCRVLTRVRVPERITLAIASSFAVLPVLIEDMTSLIYHRRIMHARAGLSTLVATFVMTLDRVEELEIVETSYDMTGLFARAKPHAITPYELLYVLHIAAMGAWGVLA
ncbi:MAG TPA: hypothetical protein VGF28_02625 [Thermoanaerobaculia bacterium]|jgi:hypothetical protein